MTIIQPFCTNHPCYKIGKKIAPKGLMLHSVGCNQPNAIVFVNTWNKTNAPEVLPHAVIDGNSGEIYQTLPWNYRGWHGGGSSNDTHIGVEMCEPACIKYTSGANFTCSDFTTAKKVATTTYNSAVKLFAYLCKEYNLDPLADGVIVSHSEGYKRGIASGHADPEHLWRGLGLNYTMNTFRKAVHEAMNSGKTENTSKPDTEAIYKVQVGAFSSKENAEKYLEGLKKAGYSDAFVTSTSAKKEPVEPAKPKKSVDEIAKEVVAGKWGNGSERKRLLQEAGYDYNAVQKIVNKLM